MKIWIMILCAIAISVSFGNASKGKSRKKKNKELQPVIDEVNTVKEKMNQHFQELDDKITNIIQGVQQILDKTNGQSNFWTNSKSHKFCPCNSDNTKRIYDGSGYRNCYEIMDDSNETLESGVYAIYLSGSNESKEVYCDMDTDGGGWTIFQRRGEYPSQTGFDQNWASYVEGFGDLEAEFWLGLTTINALTQQGCTELRIDLEDQNSNTAYAYYDRFEIDDESNNYALHIGSYEGNAGNSLLESNGMQFSTLDKDNDRAEVSHCASIRNGAWWYKHCAFSNLNGVYGTDNVNTLHNIFWYHWKKDREPLKLTEMKLRPSSFSSP